MTDILHLNNNGVGTIGNSDFNVTNDDTKGIKGENNEMSETSSSERVDIQLHIKSLQTPKGEGNITNKDTHDIIVKYAP